MFVVICRHAFHCLDVILHVHKKLKSAKYMPYAGVSNSGLSIKVE